jgi:hypothetical protein
MKFSDSQRGSLNKSLEGHATLSTLTPHFSYQRVTALLTIKNPIGYAEWYREQLYWLNFNRVAAIHLVPGLNVKLPPELANIQNPSKELMELLIRLFRGQHIFEWEECFVSEEDLKGGMPEAAFHFSFDDPAQDATEWVKFFSDGRETHWQIWIQYGDAEMFCNGNLLDIDSFIDEVEAFINTRPA